MLPDTPPRRHANLARRTASWFAILLSLIAADVAAVRGDEPAALKDPFSAEQRAHWAFQPLRRPDVPHVDSEKGARTPLDAFVRNRLDEEGIGFAPDADRTTLLRRLKFDLLGLPPTPEEVDEFLADDRPDAFEQLVDRLLASPHYGETWGRLWLDVVRYADTAGYNADPLRPLAWQYRDYVVRSFNEDKPFARFLEEQLAGDELFPDDADALVATGYLRMWPDESNASNILLARQDALNDLTGNLGAAILGLSLACAQCHDHKFDPIPQRDFYSLQAFFAGLIPVDSLPKGSPAALADYRAQRQAWLESVEPVRQALRDLEAPARLAATAERRMKFPAIVLEALDTHPDRRSTLQRQLAFWSERQIEFKEADLLKKLDDAQKARREDLKRDLAELERTAPKPHAAVAALSIAEEVDIPPTYVLGGGSYDRREAEVKPGFLGILAPAGASTDAETTPAATGSSGRRTSLSRWITDPAHPLTWRVLANRLWQEHFGEGLVANANDFGTQSPPPTHPELLDWLAAEIAETAGGRASAGRGGSGEARHAVAGLKHLHRLIVTSAVYRQESLRAPAPAESSSAAAPLSHYPRRRLSAERVRDAILAVSGSLDIAPGGPGVCPPLPEGYNSREAWKVSENVRDHVRRSIYIQAKRNLPFPLLQAFDLPDMHESCACRSKTTTAPQALMLLNSDFVLRESRRLARRLERDANTHEPAALVDALWKNVLGRSPEADERRGAVQFLDRQRARAAADWMRIGSGPAGPSQPAWAETGREPDEHAFDDLCHALLNSNEFLYVE